MRGSMIKIGMMIGDRYEILEKIGNGGMSDVYKAKCHKLNRYVAIKILKQEFNENANFVSKFRTEAQAAAGLMHPNIVNVYDVGEENGIYYIVMEMVDGITLKKYIEKKARLSYKEAVSIAIQVSMGIEAAHKNHIIHRDIKPQNIMISRDGKVKVTDFGIAKAATSNTITSNVMGSVHYTSPEQARGGYSDEKSDIYSLGITLFEMLTGRVPFNGETTVAIAIKHIQEPLPLPSDFVPEIPYSVEQIVLKCCEKSPDRRYQSMGELIADLKQSLIDPDGDFVTGVEDGVQNPTRTLSDLDVVQIKNKTRGTVKREQEDLMRLQRQEEEPRQEKNKKPKARKDEDEYDYDPGMDRLATVLAVLGGIVVCGVVIFLLLQVFDVFSNDTLRNPGEVIEQAGSSEPELSRPSPQETESSQEESQGNEDLVEMYDLNDWYVADARTWLLQHNLFWEMESEENEEVEKDHVIWMGQWRGDNLVVIEGGMEVEKGSTIVLTVSTGPSATPAPETAGKTYDSAYATLTAAGFVVQRLEDFSETVADGLVISQSPVAGTPLEEGATVSVTVSVGPQNGRVRVPKLLGLTLDEVYTVLWQNGLTLRLHEEMYNSNYPAGQVCYQNFSEGSYIDPTQNQMTVSISLGPAPEPAQ